MERELGWPCTVNLKLVVQISFLNMPPTCAVSTWAGWSGDLKLIRRSALSQLNCSWSVRLRVILSLVIV